MRRLNLYRWLVGLPLAGYDSSLHAEQMACALVVNHGALSNPPSAGSTCYSAAAVTARARSVVAAAPAQTPGAGVSFLMAETLSPNVARRMALLRGAIGQFAIGYTARDTANYDSGLCIGVLDTTGSSERTWVAYPNEGFSPRVLATGPWSFHRVSGLLTSATVEVRRVSDEALLAVTVGPVVEGAISFKPNGWTPAAGETYRVTVNATPGGEVVYEVTLVDC
ncbi:MAG: hypothetical protein H5U40_05450 [Polyangiaceae bacterium]|nr:hypothetical protein [Polyangiaceae bacterium]